MFPKNEAKFCELAERGNLVPVYEEFSAAFETPLSVFLKIKKGPYGFLLESVEGGRRLGRYSFIGSEPQMLFTVQQGKVVISGDGCTRTCSSQDPLRELEKIFKGYRPVELPGLPGFSGGAVGYLGYDLVRYFEKLPAQPVDNHAFPEGVLMFCDTLLVFDHVRQAIQVIVNVKTGNDPAGDYRDAVKKIEKVKARLKRPLPVPAGLEQTGVVQPLGFKSNLTEKKFTEMVREAKRYIQAGDIFQVVLSQRLSFELPADPLEIYRSLRSVNPSPYMFYLELDDLQLIGSSPEILVKVENNMAEVRPIAGTRPRGRDLAEEARLAADLLADEKEKAEHLMLVDLGRNDLGRISAYGSVKVENFMEIEKYSHVMHLVSKVTGEIRPDCSCFDVLRACYPAGTVSGAPKIRAMEIIDQLEPTARGPYAGAVGYIGYSGNMDTCITIRTLAVKQGQGYLQAGAGIVADSVPEREYQETLSKAKGLLKAVERAGRGISYAALDR